MTVTISFSTLRLLIVVKTFVTGKCLGNDEYKCERAHTSKNCQAIFITIDISALLQGAQTTVDSYSTVFRFSVPVFS
jgi:hypothetical protein